MAKPSSKKQPTKPKGPSVWGLLGPYKFLIALLVAFTIAANAFNLWVPRLIAGAIDAYTAGHFALENFFIEFVAVALFIFLFTYAQNIVQVYASERVARDLRAKLSLKISTQSYAAIEALSPSKLLTNLTSDVDAIKNFVAMAIASLISSAFLIIGAAVLLLLLDWKLALVVLLVVPVIGGTFMYVLSHVRKLFIKAQEAIDKLNSIISESILGAALIRLLNLQHSEYKKFLEANGEAKDIGMKILGLFSSLIPVITFVANLATLAILVLGGHFVINGTMTIGSFTAFNSYLAILIFPIFVIGFMSNMIAQATASYGRIRVVLDAPEEKEEGGHKAELKGDVEAKNISLSFGGKKVLKNISLKVPQGSRTAVIGPTGGGKTQLLYILTGLVAPASGEVRYDGKTIREYDKQSFYGQVGFVFQDSVMFNLSLRENIAFSKNAKDEDIALAIKTAELEDFIGTLPEGLDTLVSERGTSLSGGQKQRIMLARALALNPKVLLLDDFTARVDLPTERRILANVARNYPGLTLVSVTQKIASVENYDQILLLEEGEILASGTHTELLKKSPEYVQIFESQKSTNQYELQA
jgi:ATP-binding cassette subfamily B protein